MPLSLPKTSSDPSQPLQDTCNNVTCPVAGEITIRHRQTDLSILERPGCVNCSGTREGTQRAALKATFSVHLFTIPASLLDSNLILFILRFFF
jgi:hypothetical protein